MNSGIYAITAPSGGMYVGSAVNFPARWRQHRYELRRGSHFSRGLQRASAKYGIESLVFSKLLVCRTNDLLMFEQRAVDVLRPRYNSRIVVQSQLGMRHSPESNEKNAAAHRGKKLNLTEEQRAAISRRFQGHRFNVGKPLSPEHRAKLSAAAKGKGPGEAHMKKLQKLNMGRKKPADEIARRTTTRAANRAAKFLLS